MQNARGPEQVRVCPALGLTCFCGGEPFGTAAFRAAFRPLPGRSGKKFSGPAPRSLSAGGLVCYNRGDMTERAPRRGRSRLCRPFRGASEAVPTCLGRAFRPARPAPWGFLGLHWLPCRGSSLFLPVRATGKRRGGKPFPARSQRQSQRCSAAKAGQNESKRVRGFPESRGGAAGAKQVSRCL